jgi:hypothetical protein
MSYKTEIDALDLTDLSDVSATAPNNGEVLTYDGSWGGAELQGDKIAFSFRANESWMGAGGSSYYYQVDTPASLGRAPFDTMQAAYRTTAFEAFVGTGQTQYNYSQYTSWYNSTVPRFSGVYVPAGTWLCRATFGGRTDGGVGNATVRWFTGPSVGTDPQVATMTSTGPSFRLAIQEGRICQLPTAHITTTNTTTLLGIQVEAVSTYQYGYAANWIKYFSFHVTKLA